MYTRLQSVSRVWSKPRINSAMDIKQPPEVKVSPLAGWILDLKLDETKERRKEREKGRRNYAGIKCTFIRAKCVSPFSFRIHKTAEIPSPLLFLVLRLVPRRPTFERKLGDTVLR